jgi:hypothetical protein
MARSSLSILPDITLLTHRTETSVLHNCLCEILCDWIRDKHGSHDWRFLQASFARQGFTTSYLGRVKWSGMTQEFASR